jgi:hypothetical protein
MSLEGLVFSFKILKNQLNTEEGRTDAPNESGSVANRAVLVAQEPADLALP